MIFSKISESRVMLKGVFNGFIYTSPLAYNIPFLNIKYWFLYYNESVKRACEYVDAMAGKRTEQTFEELLEIVDTAVNMIELTDTDMGSVVCDMFYHTIYTYLNVENLTEGSRFHDYLMYDALSYYRDTHYIKAGTNSYRVESIGITIKIMAGGRLQACLYGHMPVACISPFLYKNVCIKITCPHCGARRMEFLNHTGVLVYNGKVLDTAKIFFFSLEKAIDNFIMDWERTAENNRI